MCLHLGVMVYRGFISVCVGLHGFRWGECACCAVSWDLIIGIWLWFRCGLAGSLAPVSLLMCCHSENWICMIHVIALNKIYSYYSIIVPFILMMMMINPVYSRIQAEPMASNLWLLLSIVDIFLIALGEALPLLASYIVYYLKNRIFLFLWHIPTCVWWVLLSNMVHR